MLELLIYEAPIQVNNYVRSILSEEEHPTLLILTPSSEEADQFRLYYSDFISTFVQRYHRDPVQTFSSFLQRQYKEKQINPLPIVDKSTLMMMLSTVWKRQSSYHLSYQDSSQEPLGLQFSRFYDDYLLFTQLRSSGPQELFWEQCQALFEPARAMLFFTWHQLIKEMDIVDEAAMMHQVLVTHSDGLIESTVPLLLWGFVTLSPLQGDFFKLWGGEKSLARAFCSASLFETLGSESWQKWTSVSFLPICPDQSMAYERHHLFYHPQDFPSLWKKTLHEQQKRKIIVVTLEDTVLSSLTSTLSQIKAEFKERTPHLQAELEFVYQELTQLFVMDEIIKLENIQHFIKRRFFEVLEQESLFPSEQRFRLLKIYQDVDMILQDYEKLSDINQELTIYDLFLLNHILKLKIPRVYLHSTLTDEQEGPKVFLIPLTDLGPEHFQDCYQRLFLVTLSQWKAFVSQLDQKRHLQQEEWLFLKEFGPQSHPSEKKKYLKDKCFQLLKNPIMILMEKDCYVIKKEWEEWFDYSLDQQSFYQDSEPPTPILKQDRMFILDHSFSIKSLELYQQCPQRFYGEKVLFLKKTIEEKQKMSNLDYTMLYRDFFRQMIDHQVIDNQQWIDDWLNKHHKVLTEFYQHGLNVEMNVFKVNALHLVKGLNEVFGEYHVEWNKKNLSILDEQVIYGHVRAVSSFVGGRGIWEMHLNPHRIPRIKDILDGECVHPWFYLLTQPEVLQEHFFILWVCFREIEKSLILFSHEEDRKRFEERYSAKMTVAVLPPSIIEQRLGHFKEQTLRSLHQLREDQTFKPQPLTKQICQTCSMKSYCPGLGAIE